jgi:cytoskeletal protein CcmA (bactofilin family)
MKDQSERQMIVGNGISVQGRIDNCDRLVIDGNVNCELSSLKTLIISDAGSFKGQGNVQDAEISGRFEGDLVVTGHITIMQTGRVDGKITYNSIEIKPGGKFTGSIVLKETNPGSGPAPVKSEPNLLDRAVKNRLSAPADGPAPAN